MEDGSSLVCVRCGALIARTRLEQHKKYWVSLSNNFSFFHYHLLYTNGIHTAYGTSPTVFVCNTSTNSHIQQCDKLDNMSSSSNNNTLSEIDESNSGFDDLDSDVEMDDMTNRFKTTTM